MNVLSSCSVRAEPQIFLGTGSVGSLVQGCSKPCSKKGHRHTKRCNEIRVPILSSQEPRLESGTDTRHSLFSQAFLVRPPDCAIMMNILAQSRSTAAGDANGGGRGGGKGRGRGRGPAGLSTTSEVMTHMIPFLTSLDRRLGVLEDRRRT